MEDIFKPNLTDAEESYIGKLTITDGGFIQGRQFLKPLHRIKDGYEKKNTSQLPKILEADKSPSLRKLAHEWLQEQDGSQGISDDPVVVRKGRQSSETDGLKEISPRSLSRTRDRLIQLVSMNDRLWRSFVTLTFSDKVTEVKEANKMFSTWVKSVKRAFPEFRYIGVPEFQKSGRVHYHLLTNLVCGDFIEKLPLKRLWNPSSKEWTELEYYNIKYWCYGFSSAFPLDTTDSNFNVSLYITKYLFKDVDTRLFGHNKILRSNGLKEPETYYLRNNDMYNQAISFLLQQGYDVDNYLHEGVKKYDMPVSIDTCHKVSSVDVEYLRFILDANKVYCE